MGTTAKERLLAVYREHDFRNPPPPSTSPLKLMTSFKLFNTYSYNLHCHESDLAVPTVYEVRWTARLRCAMTGRFIFNFPVWFQTQIKTDFSTGVGTPGIIKVCLGVFAPVYHWLIKKFINFYSSFVHAIGRYICPRSTHICKKRRRIDQ